MNSLVLFKKYRSNYSAVTNTHRVNKTTFLIKTLLEILFARCKRRPVVSTWISATVMKELESVLRVSWMFFNESICIYTDTWLLNLLSINYYHLYMHFYVLAL